MLEDKGPQYTRKAVSEYYRQMPVDEVESFFHDMFTEATAALKELGEVVDATVTPIRPVVEDGTPQAG